MKTYEVKLNGATVESGNCGDVLLTFIDTLDSIPDCGEMELYRDGVRIRRVAYDGVENRWYID